jgi:hypothetical protein
MCNSVHSTKSGERGERGREERVFLILFLCLFLSIIFGAVCLLDELYFNNVVDV